MMTTRPSDAPHHSTRTPASAAQVNKTLTISGGNKGGVGKSLLATTAASLLLAQGEAVTLIEADQTNPDVARRFARQAPVLLADVSDRDGWIALLETLEAVTTPHCVMSLPAGLHDIEAIQPLLRRTLAALRIDLQLIFCLSRQTDSIDLIGRSLATGLAAIAQRGLAVKNGFFGRDEQFDRWHGSKLRQQWHSKGLNETYLPELNHRLVDCLESQPQPLHLLASAGLTTALRLDLEDWLTVAQACLAPLWQATPTHERAA